MKMWDGDIKKCLGELLTDSQKEVGPEASPILSIQWDNWPLVPVGPPRQTGRPLSSPSPLPCTFSGRFYHIKMFGLMGLTCLQEE